MNAPTCFFSALDGNTGDFILLLADLAPARNGNLRAGCSLEEAELALNDVAKLHADWWESPQLAGMDWLSRAKPDGIALFQEMYQRAWGPFVDRMKDQLPPEILEIGERYGNSYARIAASLSQPPLTLTHGDYHLDNLFFNTSSDGVLSATIIDWQCAAHGRGVFDVAYFLGMSLPPEMRRSHEREVLRSYHAILQERGVQGYSFDRCWDEYRLSFFTLLARLVVVNGGGLQISEEQLEYYSMIMPRQIAPMVDLDIGNLLPQ
jgi:hypothetical protein